MGDKGEDQVIICNQSIDRSIEVNRDSPFSLGRLSALLMDVLITSAIIIINISAHRRIAIFFPTWLAVGAWMSCTQ